MGIADGNDPALVQASLEGDREAFAQIVTRYQALIATVAYSATGNLAQSVHGADVLPFRTVCLAEPAAKRQRAVHSRPVPATGLALPLSDGVAPFHLPMLTCAALCLSFLSLFLRFSYRMSSLGSDRSAGRPGPIRKNGQPAAGAESRVSGVCRELKVLWPNQAEELVNVVCDGSHVGAVRSSGVDPRAAQGDGGFQAPNACPAEGERLAIAHPG